MREKDIILSACGVGEYGELKGCVSVNYAKWHMEEQKEEIVKEFFTNEPVINITRTPRFTMVDLAFEMGEDSDFYEMLDVLRMSSEPGNSFDEEGDVMPVLYMTMMPYEYEMEYFLTGLHGVWCLIPSEQVGEIDTVRLIFNNELFSVYQVDEEVLDALREEVYLDGEDFGDREDFGAGNDLETREDFEDGEGLETREGFEDGEDFGVKGDSEDESYGLYGDFGESDLEEDLEEYLETDDKGKFGNESGNGVDDWRNGDYGDMTGELLEKLDEDIWRA